MSFSLRLSLIFVLIVSLLMALFALYFVLGTIAPAVVITSILIVVAVGLAFLILFEIAVMKPLRNIQSVMKKIEEGAYGVKIKQSKFQEMQEFIRSLNNTLQRIQRERESIKDAKSVLEIRVQARTRELQMLADGLEQKVQQRTKELEGKIGELERFQKLAVGRELKMVELKQEIKHLREQLEEK